MNNITEKLKWIANVAVLFAALMFSSCKKFVEIDPPKVQLVGETVFESDATAIAAMAAVYIDLTNTSRMSGSSAQSAIALTGFSADELTNYSATYLEFSTNAVVSTNSLTTALWGGPYSCIYQANAIMEGLKRSESVSAAVKKELEGEAKFVRAFCYFYLTNMFGNVPLALTTDYRVNNILSRKPAAEVYSQVIADLKDAQLLLADDYSVSAGERVRPNKAAATALLAKVYLFNKDYPNAELSASAVLNNKMLYDTVALANVFLKNSKEAIWQLMPNATTRNTDEGALFILTRTPVTTLSVSDGLYNAFEVTDKRKTSWLNPISGGGKTYYYPYKYKIRTGGTGSNPVVPLTEYSMVLRIGEQYLIRAEARAQQNKLTGTGSAQEDINVIRKRARLGNTTASNQASLLLAIEQERRVELFAELGWHRWFDLKRTGRADAVLGPLKGAGWQATDVLYPVPFTEIQNNRNLAPQNQGYN